MGLSVPESVQIGSAVLSATVEVLLRSSIKKDRAVRSRHPRRSNSKYSDRNTISIPLILNKYRSCACLHQHEATRIEPVYTLFPTMAHRIQRSFTYHYYASRKNKHLHPQRLRHQSTAYAAETAVLFPHCHVNRASTPRLRLHPRLVRLPACIQTVETVHSLSLSQPV